MYDQLNSYIKIFIFAADKTLRITRKMEKEETGFGAGTLSDFERSIIVDKGTEIAFSGEYLYNTRKGIYMCRQCGAPMYRSEDKFESSCGWPSFDDEIKGAVRRAPDADGERMEIVCARCGAHMGHVFTGEGYTPKDTRHCVNSISMVFVPAAFQERDTESKKETAIFAGGCFWGMEYFMKKEPGIISVQCGYMGGHVRHPSYEEVCTGTTGHAEVVKVVFDPAVTSFEKLARLYFEIHDPTQENGQGPDIGPQYRSQIFYVFQEQRAIAEKLIAELLDKGYDVTTKLEPADTFWMADVNHQGFYEKKGGIPYCHAYKKRF